MTEAESTVPELKVANELLQKENTWLRGCIRRGLAGFVIVGALLAIGWMVNIGFISYENNKTLQDLFKEHTKQMEMVRGK